MKIILAIQHRGSQKAAKIFIVLLFGTIMILSIIVLIAILISGEGELNKDWILFLFIGLYGVVIPPLILIRLKKGIKLATERQIGFAILFSFYAPVLLAIIFGM